MKQQRGSRKLEKGTQLIDSVAMKRGDEKGTQLIGGDEKGTQLIDLEMSRVPFFALRKEFRTSVANGSYTNHNWRHLKAGTADEAQQFSKGGLAQFLPEFNDSRLEKLALQKGVVVEHGGGYHAFLQFDRSIGFDNGNATTWIRAELSGGVYHGHPMHQSRLPKAFSGR